MSAANGNKIASDYIRENFDTTDRLAVVLLNKRAGTVIQRLAPAEAIAAPDFQAWLAEQNQHRYEVYLSMNALHMQALGRTKQDIATIRHVYLDFDDHGTAAVETMLGRADLPKPNYLLNSSPDKWQVVWKVDGFAKEYVESLQKWLARECGADPAATDCARVLRLPGFVNYKYAKPHFVNVEGLARETYRPEDFPPCAAEDRDGRDRIEIRPRVKRHRFIPSQSEKDWLFAKRALARGDSPALVAAAVAQYRRFDKHNPQYYAELTVRKAAEAIRIELNRSSGPERA
jgi:hypothetical protein